MGVVWRVNRMLLKGRLTRMVEGGDGCASGDRRAPSAGDEE